MKFHFINKKLTLLFASIALISCEKSRSELENVFKRAGENRKELEKVLNHYHPNSNDSIKYRAAEFLLKNMNHHFSYRPNMDFDIAFDSINNYPNNRFRLDIFERILDSISKEITITTPKLLPDLETLNSEFLINNIELSFEAWNNLPKEKRASFEDFCNYILPYKSFNEPIEFKSREKLNCKYSWVNNLLKNGMPLRQVVDSVASIIGHKNMVQIKKYYPIPLSMSQIEKSKLGLCDDGVNYLVNVFRSQGIISTRDMVPHWGNHPSSGHSWVYFKYGSEEYSKQVHKNVDVKLEYMGESIPKVFRTTFAHNRTNPFLGFAIDVTSEYVPTVKLNIKNVMGNTIGTPVLCIFDVSKKWEPITSGEINGDDYIYKNVGVNVLYMAANLKNNKVTPINYPFYINEAKSLHFFKPQNFSLDTVALTRKIGLTTPRHKRKKQWIVNLNGGTFEGSNNKNFEEPVVLHRISKFNSTHTRRIGISGKRKFKYLRFNSQGKESYLSKLRFYGENEQLLTGKVFKNNNFEYIWGDGAFDDSPLTFSGGKNFTLGIGIQLPQRLKFIEFQVRNDDNHINAGEDYELYYWDKSWKSLGKKTAKDTVLYYSVHKNSLLWLRNLTKGKEEHVFYIDDNRKQRWLGFDNY